MKTYGVISNLGGLAEIFMGLLLQNFIGLVVGIFIWLSEHFVRLSELLIWLLELFIWLSLKNFRGSLVGTFNGVIRTLKQLSVGIFVGLLEHCTEFS